MLKSYENGTEGLQFFFLASQRGKFLSVQGGNAVTMLAIGCNDRNVSFHISIFSH